MRLNQRIKAEINEYLRLHYTGGMPQFAVRNLNHVTRAEGSAAHRAYEEDSSVVIDEYEEKLLPPEKTVEIQPDPAREEKIAPKQSYAHSLKEDQPAPCYMPARQYAAPTGAYGDLSDRLNTLDESFQQALLRLIDERGMKDSTCYKRAGVDRKLFSKIRSNPAYRPSKPTAVAFAIALELNLDETTDFLRKAGYALSHSSKFDVIVEYFIVTGRFSLRELNGALYEFDQPLVNG